MERHPYLRQLSDDDLFILSCRLVVEYQARIIELLDKNHITQFTFESPNPKCTVWNFKDNVDITVASVGYTIDMFGTKKLPGKYLYLIDASNIVYSGDDCVLDSSLWDIYREMKCYLK